MCDFDEHFCDRDDVVMLARRLEKGNQMLQAYHNSADVAGPNSVIELDKQAALPKEHRTMKVYQIWLVRCVVLVVPRQ